MTQTEEAKRLYDQGIDDYRAGEYEDALDALMRARNLYAQAGNRKGEAEALNDAGAVCIQIEEWGQAKGYFDEALAIREDLDDLSGQGITLGNMGMMYEHQKESELAIEAYERAIALFQETGEQGNKKAIVNQMSKLKLKKGKVLDAVTEYELPDEEEAKGAQKVARKLFSLMGRFMGGGAGEEDDDEDVIDVLPEPPSDEED